MGTTTLDDETILPPPTVPATRCGIVGSGTHEDDEDEEDEDEDEDEDDEDEEIERDKQGEGGDEHGDDDEEDEEEDEGGADCSRSYVPSGDGSRAIPGAFAEP